MKEKKKVTQDVELTADDLKELASQFKAEYKAKIGKDFPTDPKEQLFGAIKAVFRSWDNPRANIYRMDHDIPVPALRLRVIPLPAKKDLWANSL